MHSVFPSILRSEIPSVSREEMIEIDRIMEDEWGIGIYQMMENAGYLLARFVTAFYRDANHVIVLVGKGNNGGGGLVAARRLVSWGYNVIVFSAVEINEFTQVTTRQLKPLMKLKVPIITSIQEQQATLASCSGQIVLVDALLGYGVQSSPRGNYASLISLANSIQAPIISLDTPTGLDVTTGEVYEPCIKACKTLTLATVKKGFFTEEAAEAHGEVFIGDISIPPVTYERIGLSFPSTIFKASSIIHVSHDRKHEEQGEEQ